MLLFLSTNFAKLFQLLQKFPFHFKNMYNEAIVTENVKNSRQQY